MFVEFAVEFFKRNRVLSALGWYCAGLFMLMLVLVFLDQRVVHGVGIWVIPAKIVFSMSVYAWTLAWFSKYAAKPHWRIQSLSVVLAVVVVIESGCLAIQAARGTTAYFNISTDFDALINSLMGWMIATNLLMMLFFLVLLRKPGREIQPSYLWGIRFGFLVFFFGAWIGNEMLTNGAHAVGAANGTTLPVLNWSSQAGDLRVAHAIGLLGLQILPILGYGISIWRAVPNKIGKLLLISATAAGYSYLVFVLYQQAMNGRSLLAA